MKIAIGSKLQRGAFGGGNQFAVSLSRFLLQRGIDITYDLKDDNIDLIVLTEPRKYLNISAFDHTDIMRYLLKKRDTLVVHRINECDERKGTRGINKFLIHANLCANHTIFISSWLANLYVNNGFSHKNYSVILNGADSQIFNREERKKWDKNFPLKIVTHHWAGNWFKGFDVYCLLDNFLEKWNWKSKLEFTYIGNLPKNIKFKNVKIMPACFGKDLASRIKENHVYLTASLNEPAGMHHIEGALCGLPLLYRNSGALAEYCNGFGISFNGLDDFESSLLKLIENYDFYFNKLNEYSNSADKMCQQYYALFISLLKKKAILVNSPKLNISDFKKYRLKSYIITRKIRITEILSKRFCFRDR